MPRRICFRLVRFAFLAIVLSVCVAVPAQALTWPKSTDRWLNDFAGLLSSSDEDAINAELRAYQNSSGNQVVVAIFPSLEGESLEDVSIDIAKAWKIGTKGKDNGALLSIFVQDRKTRIETGYGAESRLTDAVSSRILRDTLAPAFREGKYAEGIRGAIAAIESTLEGNPPAASRKAVKRGLPPGVIIFIVFIFVAIVSRIIQSAARTPATISGRRAMRRLPWWWWMGGGGGGWGGGTFGGGGWGGGGGGWGGGSGGGGGGFSGGGGSFGGGGASGSW